MGIFDRVKSDLEWKAGQEVSSTIFKGASKLFKKGEKVNKCPKCKKPITESGLKFCSSCGAKLMVTCQKCVKDFPVGTKFCDQCGEVLK